MNSINANAAAAATLKAYRYRGFAVAGPGIAHPTPAAVGWTNGRPREAYGFVVLSVNVSVLL